MVINWNKNGLDLFQIKEKKEKRKEGREGGREMSAGFAPVPCTALVC